MKFIGQKILQVLEILKKYHLPEKKEEIGKYIANFEKEIEKNPLIKKLRAEVKKLALKFPIP
jgi:glycine/serine hydroxymethyltransferase